MKHTRVEDHHDLTTGRGRLAYLAVILDRVEALRQPFNINDWQETVGDCGTAACAMGWACRDQLLREAGLTVGAWTQPVWQGKTGFRALMDFTDLPAWRDRVEGDYQPGTVGWLFLPGAYDTSPTAADVAARIRQVLAEAET